MRWASPIEGRDPGRSDGVRMLAVAVCVEGGDIRDDRRQVCALSRRRALGFEGGCDHAEGRFT